MVTLKSTPGLFGASSSTPSWVIFNAWGSSARDLPILASVPASSATWTGKSDCVSTQPVASPHHSSHSTMTSKPHLGSNWSLASIDRASAKLQETNPSIKSVKNTTNSHDACQICTPDNSALAHPDLVDSVNPTVSHCSTAPTSKVLIDAGIQRPRLSQRKAASMRNVGSFPVKKPKR